MSFVLRKIRMFAYPFGGFSDGVFVAFVNALLPLYLTRFTQSPALIGTLVALVTFESACGALLVGPLSDRITVSMGKRKIFILGGCVATVILLFVLFLTTSLQFFILFLLLVGLSRSITIGPFMALLAKNAAVTNRGIIASFIALFGLTGQVTVTLLALFFWKQAIPASAFLVLAVLFLIPMSVVLFYSVDDTHSAKTQGFSGKVIRSFLTEEKRRYYIVSQLLLWFGINSVLPFFTLFIKEYLGLSQQEAVLFYFCILLSSGGFAYPLAMLGKQKGEISAFSIGLGAFFVTACIGIFSKALPMQLLYLLALLAGLGNAAVSVFSFSLFSKLVSEEDMGLTSGVYAFVIAGFAPVTAFLSGLLIDSFGYPSMFFLLGIAVVGSFLFLTNKALRTYPGFQQAVGNG